MYRVVVHHHRARLRRSIDRRRDQGLMPYLWSELLVRRGGINPSSAFFKEHWIGIGLSGKVSGTRALRAGLGW